MEETSQCPQIQFDSIWRHFHYHDLEKNKMLPATNRNQKCCLSSPKAQDNPSRRWAVQTGSSAVVAHPCFRKLGIDKSLPRKNLLVILEK